MVGEQTRFEFELDVTAFSEWHWVWLMPLLYLLGIKALKMYAANCTPGGKGLNLFPLVVIHNASLSIISAKLFWDMARELIYMFSEGGAWSVFCDAGGRWTSGPIYYYLYINYLLKYVELGDTALLAVRNKPTEFLHVYHHAITLVLCLTQLRGQTSLQWLIVIMNLFVHIVMYAFYALHTLGYHVWWKKYLTMLQIAQFIIGICTALPIYVISQLAKLGILPTSMQCHGDTSSQTFGLLVLFSYLALFLQFYENRYDHNHNQSIKPTKPSNHLKKPF
jgi:fatty acid elongase 3